MRRPFTAATAKGWLPFAHGAKFAVAGPDSPVPGGPSLAAGGGAIGPRWRDHERALRDGPRNGLTG